MKKIASVVILCAMVLGVALGVAGSSGEVQKTLTYRDIKISVNGKEITPTDATGAVVEPFIIDGTTYLPVRAVASAVGLEVGWDEATNTVRLGDNAGGHNATPAQTPAPAATIGQQNALKSAKSYLNVSAFSRSGLIKQLEYEGYSEDEATYAVDNCGADWFEQAVKCAKSYLDVSAFSREGLIKQLEYEGFTHEQAVYGVEQNGY